MAMKQSISSDEDISFVSWRKLEPPNDILRLFSLLGWEYHTGDRGGKETDLVVDTIKR